MVSDQQVKRLWRLAGGKLSLEIAAAKAGMDPKTARKYLRDRRLPSEMRQKHTWRTRPDSFADIWAEIRQLLAVEPGLQAKTIFEHLQQAHPGRFSDGQVRTLRRRISYWRATEGPPREVFFARTSAWRTVPIGLYALSGTGCDDQWAGLSASDLSLCAELFQLGDRQHLLLRDLRERREGLQNAVWQLDGVPLEHRTDRMSAAVNNLHLKVTTVVLHLQQVADSDLARGLGFFSVRLNPAEFTCSCSERTRLEKSGGPEPLVHSHVGHDPIFVSGGIFSRHQRRCFAWNCRILPRGQTGQNHSRSTAQLFKSVRSKTWTL